MWVLWLVEPILALAALLSFLVGGWIRRRFRYPQLLRIVAVGGTAALLPAVLPSATGLTGPGTSVAAGILGLVLLGTLAVLLGTLRIASKPAAVRRRVLAVGAHPDDLELACGGTLAKLVDSGHEVHMLVMSHGARGGDNAVRPLEAKRAGKLLGAASVTVFDFPDTRLNEQAAALVSAIESAMVQVEPDIVLTHSGNDQHQDHNAVHLATLRAARQHPAILCYESPSATSDFRPSVFVGIDQYVEAKVAAVAAFRDQAGKPYMTAERIRGLASFRGAQAKARFAEGYEPVRLLSSAVGDL
ncbi:PIG-L deacetylase family protein [Kribbella sp. NPDC051137]|uniref:PIG-L deacetylase family protein n=1 Tax=Kribbella sp. NPDC051137 TaxID=3155045 RepID=UPI002F7610BB